MVSGTNSRHERRLTAVSDLRDQPVGRRQEDIARDGLDGQGLATAGLVCGIVATAVQLLWDGFVVLAILADSSSYEVANAKAFPQGAPLTKVRGGRRSRHHVTSD